MKIVDRSTFLAMPSGTLFSKYEPCVFGDLSIKGDNVGSNDFCVQGIADSIVSDSSGDFVDKLDHAAETGDGLLMDFDSESRDGCFDNDQLFAVWEKPDIVALIERLTRCIADIG